MTEITGTNLATINLSEDHRGNGSLIAAPGGGGTLVIADQRAVPQVRVRSLNANLDREARSHMSAGAPSFPSTLRKGWEATMPGSQPSAHDASVFWSTYLPGFLRHPQLLLMA